MALDKNKFKLPKTVVTPIDLGRLQRELLAVDEFLAQSAVRTPGEPLHLPKSSRELDEIAKVNKLNLLDNYDRQELIKKFAKIREKSPVLHMSFAVEPSPVFQARLIAWLRSEIHPSVLVQIGLQPSIAAGCTLRTDNRYFDFSLRRHLLSKRELLINRFQQERVE